MDILRRDELRRRELERVGLLEVSSSSGLRDVVAGQDVEQATAEGVPSANGVKTREEMRELKGRLKELQELVNALERPAVAPQPAGVRQLRRVQQPPLQARDQLLAEMQEQLRLQKELHLRRKELEELMRKDLMDSLCKNEDRIQTGAVDQPRGGLVASDSKSDLSSIRSANGWFHDGTAPANHRSRQLSLSSNLSQQHQGDTAETNVQLKALRAQIESLHLEVRRQSEMRIGSLEQRTGDYNSNVPLAEVEAIRERQQQQHGQMIHLTNSLNQCFHVLQEVQREVAGLQRTVEALARQQEEIARAQLQNVPPPPPPPPPSGPAPRQPQSGLGGGSNNNNNNNTNTSPLRQNSSYTANSENLGPTSVVAAVQEAANRLSEPWHLPDIDFGASLAMSNHQPWLQYQQNHHQQQQHPQGATAVVPPDHQWSFQQQHQPMATPDRMTLNNQVPAPGVRANNYWDNFRSFSRQNRLSASSGSGQMHEIMVPPSAPAQQQQQQASCSSAAAAAAAAAAAPNVAQVTPRQLHAAAAAAAASAATQHQQPRAALIEPNFSSPPRPRRKQKINREQNREESSNLHPYAHHPSAAAMVHPMPHNSGHQTGQEVNLASVSPVVSSLTRSIYSQINNVISRHEHNPDRLARLYHELQSLGSSDNEQLQPRRADLPPASSTVQALRRLDISDGQEKERMVPAQQFEYPSQPRGWPLNRNSPKTRAEKKRFPADRRANENEHSSSPDIWRARQQGGEGNLGTIHRSLGELSSFLQGAAAAAAIPCEGRVHEAAEDAAEGAAVDISADDEDEGQNNSRKQSQTNEELVRMAAAAVDGAVGMALPMPKNAVMKTLNSNANHNEVPKNMMQQKEAGASHMSQDQEETNSPNSMSENMVAERGFINVNIEFLDEAAGNAAVVSVAAAGDMSEMAEADQDHSPDHSVLSANNSFGAGASGGAAAAVARETAVGAPGAAAADLDRSCADEADGAVGGAPMVACVLSNNELNRLRDDEEESMRNLVEEVLCDDDHDASADLAEDEASAPIKPSQCK